MCQDANLVLWTFYGLKLDQLCLLLLQVTNLQKLSFWFTISEIFLRILNRLCRNPLFSHWSCGQKFFPSGRCMRQCSVISIVWKKQFPRRLELSLSTEYQMFWRLHSHGRQIQKFMLRVVACSRLRGNILQTVFKENLSTKPAEVTKSIQKTGYISKFLDVL